jgi:hypothetical protein
MIAKALQSKTSRLSMPKSHSATLLHIRKEVGIEAKDLYF